MREENPSPKGRGGEKCPSCGTVCGDHSTLLQHRRKVHGYTPPGEETMDEFGLEMPGLERRENTEERKETRQSQLGEASSGS